ncbi:MAG TPA: VOC family protein [Chthonomonadaceae bacterium]|nr:VOC family protein [Chthonomonadaceae bacterium]
MLRLDYTRLLVADFRASFLFYRDVLGFKPTFGGENDVYADFKAGDTSLALFQRDLMASTVGTAGLPASAVCQDRAALIFGVESVDATVAELQAHGVTFITEPQDRAAWGIRTAHFRDPDGNLLEINSPIAN